MRLTRMLKRILMPARNQGGFSIAEVMVAGALLAIVSLPMMQMFGTSFRVTNLTEDLNKVQVCVRHFTEETRAIPFYEPYVSAEGDRDMDDLYWGDARGLNNSWNTAPEISVKGYDVNPYPQFRVTAKMVYLNDDISESSMRGTWGPKIPNRDDPVDSTNKSINMIKFQIKAYWKVDGVETSKSNHSLVSIMTRSQVQANLGVSDLAVEAGKQGTSANSAPHIYNTVHITITGFGFKAGCTASLLMPSNSDITVKGLNFVDQGTLTGYVDLASDGTAGKPWSPRAETGGWAVKVLVGSAFAVLNDGLVAQFPKPVLTGLNPLTAGNTSTNELVTVTGNPILSLAAAGGYNNCRAVSQLVWRNADGSEDVSKTIYGIDGTTTVSGDGYGAGSDQVAARFNLPDGSAWGAYPHNYYAKVWNCKDYDQLGQLGDVSTSTSTIAAYLQVVEPSPEVTSAYQTGIPARNWGFSNKTYNLTIKGKFFDTAGVTVYVGRGGTPPGAPSVQGSGVVVVDSETITANFNLAGMAGNEGWSWVYVRNNASGRYGSTINLYQVRKAPTTSGISNTDGKGFKYNYYDIAVSLSGQDFYSGYQVYYQNSSGGDVYQMGVGDGEGAPVWSSSNAMTGYLNLIDDGTVTLPVGTYKIWAADPYESTNITANTTFTSAYGAPVLLASGSPYSPTSVWIQFKYRIKVIIWWGWSGQFERSESGTTRAWAPNGESSRQTRVDFQVQGMGFLDSNTGSTTNLNISNNGLNGSFAAVVNRAGKTVYLRTTNWGNVNTSSSWLLATAGATTYNLVLTNNNGSGSTSYTNRWQTQDEEP
jgi:hypothetical protein